MQVIVEANLEVIVAVLGIVIVSVESCSGLRCMTSNAWRAAPHERMRGEAECEAPRG